MLTPDEPALILAPMEGLTDAPMRALMGELGAFSFAVSEFVRVAAHPVPPKVFVRQVPELSSPTGLCVQVQLLGGDPGRLAESALAAVAAGAQGIDLNFGCPAKTVNRNDGGATLLKHPDRIRAIVRAVRDAMPAAIPVSAKLRLGWDDPSDVDTNARMAAEGGASWITLHARTRTQGYRPPVDWGAVGRVRAALDVPVVANGDIWTVDDFRRCREVTGCRHFMLGRGALADPALPGQVAASLGLPVRPSVRLDWPSLVGRFLDHCAGYPGSTSRGTAARLKQWLKLAPGIAFDPIRRCESPGEIVSALSTLPSSDLAALTATH